MGGLVGLLFIFAVALFAEQIAPYGYDELDFNNLRIAPTMRDQHYFGTDLLERDFFSRVVFGIRTLGLGRARGHERDDGDRNDDRRDRRLLRRVGRQRADAVPTSC